MKAMCALVQYNFSVDVDENLERLGQYVREAGRAGAQIIGLPELATTEYFCVGMHPEFFDLAQPIPGPATESMAQAARDANAYVLFPLYERASSGELYNAAVFIDRQGEIVGKYRKNMIPAARVGDIEGNEKFYFRPGNLGYPVWDTDLGIKVGTTICYDRHFPEGPRSLALNGADVMIVPTATPLWGDMWEIELRGHAIANIFWVGAVNRVGRDRDGHFPLEFYGRSCWVGPNGDVVSRAGDQGDETIYCEIDTELSKTFRENWGWYRDRRPEVYEAVTAR